MTTTALYNDTEDAAFNPGAWFHRRGERCRSRFGSGSRSTGRVPVRPTRRRTCTTRSTLLFPRCGAGGLPLCDPWVVT
jgi:hypothetical protein